MSRARTPAAAIAIAAVLVVAASAVTFALLRTPQSGTGASDVPPSRTLLLQVRDDAGRAVGNVLVSGGPPAAAIVLPRTLLVPVPEPLPLEEAGALADTLASRDGVSTLLGARVDAALSIDRLSLAALVDAAGGAPLDVRTRIVERDDTGAVIASILPGARVLNGADAAAYALVPQPGETDEVRLTRLVDVLGRALLGLPAGTDDLRAVVVSLGSSARATEGTDAIVTVLQELRRALADGALQVVTLPVVTLVDGTASVMASPQGPGTVRGVLPGALLAPGEAPRPRVEVRRAGAGLGRALAAGQVLADAGLPVVSTVDVPTAGRDTVLVPDDSDRARAIGEQVAMALGIPVDDVVVTDLGPLPVPDAVVVLSPTTAHPPGIG